jgi:hypothetical protein
MFMLTCPAYIPSFMTVRMKVTSTVKNLPESMNMAVWSDKLEIKYGILDLPIMYTSTPFPVSSVSSYLNSKLRVLAFP